MVKIKKLFICVSILFLLFGSVFPKPTLKKGLDLQVKPGEDMKTKEKIFVKKNVLKNGLTVLVKEVHNIPKVSVQLFYNVGSKDERTGEKGIAHLIEHMVFKGTERLSETDINFITHQLSGSCNAFTSYDYTGYMFNLPSQNWKEILPIMADCMAYCSFKDEHLNSEMKAVIQELKMRKDNYFSKLFMEMLSAIFADHPYHHPIIGYKQDIWNVRGRDLRSFYKKHYWPNNATLVVVGDVKAEDVFKEAEKYFGSIAPNKHYKKEKFYLNQDIIAKTVTLFRDVKQPIVMLAFLVPGKRSQIDHVMDAVELILGKGKGSRLHRKLVDERQLVTSLDASSVRLFDHGLFLIWFDPKTMADVDKIEKIVLNEIDSIAKKGIAKKELERVVRQSKMAYYSKLEDVQSQAYDIGHCFLATGDENYAFTYLDNLGEKLGDEVKQLLVKYFRPSVMHKGIVLPLAEKEKKVWKELQKRSDQEDTLILSERVRETEIEEPKYAKKVTVRPPAFFDFPKPQTFSLSNGLKIFSYDNKNTPKINIVLEFRAKPYYDPQEKQGLYNFVSNMLSEGTQNYTATQLADEIESRGMSFHISNGFVTMSMLSSDLEKGLELLEELLSRPTFPEKEVEKVRQQLLTDVKNFWDDPNSISAQLIKEKIYYGHPYSKNSLGTKDSINKITRDDLIAFHKDYMSPSGAKISIVGDLSGYDLKKLLEKKLAQWKGPEVKEMVFPKLDKTSQGLIDYYINRDQVFLSLANISIDRKNKDYDCLVLFDQIFGGGVLKSLNSRLWKLREQTGLFYTIFGSLIANANKQPGMALIRTIVSLDRLNEAQEMIARTIDTVADSLTPQELEEAKRAIANALMNNFESNRAIAQAFLFLDKYGFPADYFDNRAQQLSDITLEDVKNAAKKFLNSKSMLTFRVGRIGKSDKKDKV